MTTTNQEVKTGVLHVLYSNFDVVFDRQEIRRLFVPSIEFLRIYSGKVFNLFVIETDEVGDYIPCISTKNGAMQNDMSKCENKSPSSVGGGYSLAGYNSGGY